MTAVWFKIFLKEDTASRQTDVQSEYLRVFVVSDVKLTTYCLAAYR
jgi:hypothetical protein